jgi:hypothetical protein
MNGLFSDFKTAFHHHVSQMHAPNAHLILFNKLKQSGGGYSSSIIKIFSAGVIVYSGYYYFNRHLKRTRMHNGGASPFPFFYYLNYVKKLFSRSNKSNNSNNSNNRICNGSQESNIELKVKELPEHVKYDSGWYNELNELKHSLNSLNSENASPLRETTPRGEIIMHYDGETKSFHYYSNSKNIPYSTLDAVARKYVCLHKDATIYIDIRDEVQKGREKSLKHDEDNNSKLERNINKSGTGGDKILSSAKKSLFATFKNYKTGRNVTNPLFHGKKDVVVMKENINKFIYKGTLEQYDADCPDSTGCEKKDLSYAEFKQKCNH